VRTSEAGSASSAVASRSATRGTAAPPAKTASRRPTSAAVVVSSSDTPTEVASTSRRLTPCASAASCTARVLAPVSTTIVSKNARVRTSKPIRSSPVFRIAASRCTRRAIRARPSGPW